MKKVYKIGEVETSDMKAVYNYASKNGITKIDDLLVKESKKKSKKSKTPSKSKSRRKKTRQKISNDPLTVNNIMKTIT